MRQFLVLISVLIFAQTIHAQNISGQIFDTKTIEGLPFANVILIQDDKHIAGTTTDLDGNYSFTNVNEGIYDIEAVYVGYPNHRIANINVNSAEIKVDVEMNYTDLQIPDCCCIKYYSVPLIDLQNTSTGQTLHSTDIKPRF